MRIALTPGCPNGVGPELLARALSLLPQHEHTWLWCGSRRWWEKACEDAAKYVDVSARESMRFPQVSCLDDAPKQHMSSSVMDVDPKNMRIDEETALSWQKNALLMAMQYVEQGQADAIVTGPIRKKALQHIVDKQGNVSAFAGQTELLHAFLPADENPPLMCFLGGPFVLGLATVHIPLAQVSQTLSIDGVIAALQRLLDIALLRYRAEHGADPTDAKPLRLAVLGVNPHAGEDGLLGMDEKNVVIPACRIVMEHAERAFGRGAIVLQGPIPADGFFADVARTLYKKNQNIPSPNALPDAVLAMYHDQGLAAYKLLAAGAGVNVTWGLRTIRTSPDHGTADAIAHQGKADVSSTRAALSWAVQLANARLSQIKTTHEAYSSAINEKDG